MEKLYEEKKFNQLCDEKPNLNVLKHELNIDNELPVGYYNERELIKLLLQYGTIENFVHDDVRMSVARFILQELGNLFSFYDPIHNRILSIYKVCDYMDGQIPSPLQIKYYFRHDKELCNRIDELLYSPIEILKWEKYGVSIDEDEKAKILHNKILSAIIRFKDVRIEHIISTYSERIKCMGSDSDKQIYLADLEAMQKLRVDFNKRLGLLVAQ